MVDALDRFGFHCKVLVSSEIKPHYTGMKIAGLALTVRAIRVQDVIPSMSPEEYERYAEEWYRNRADYDCFMKLTGRGTVLAVDLDEYIDVGFWGSMIGLVAKVKGVEGIVLRGGCRNTLGIQLIRFPVFCRGRGRAEVIGKVEVEPGNVNVPIVLGEAKINPGDVIVGDDDGLVVVPRKVASEVLERAERQLATDGSPTLTRQV